MAITTEKGLVSKSALTAIGDAIRAKNGSTTKYKPSEMAAAIYNLKGGNFTVATSDKFNFRVVQSANQIINSTPVGKTVSNSDGTISLALTDTTTISPNTNYIPGTIQRSYDDNTHTYTVTATDAELIDDLVQDDWSVVYQITADNDSFYARADYTGTVVDSSELQGNILVGGMQSYSSSHVGFPNRANKILKFKNTFITSVGTNFLSDCPSLTYVELPNLTEAGENCLKQTAITSVELPNLITAGDKLLCGRVNIRSIELPKLINLGEYSLDFRILESDPVYFIDCGYATNINSLIFRYTRVIVLRANTVPTSFKQSQLPEALYIVPSALVDAYKSKVRSQDYVTALEESPFADGKTVCGNNMETVYFDGTVGEAPDLGEGNMLCFNGSRWQYESYFLGMSASKTARSSIYIFSSGFYFLSKLTDEQGYTIPT